MKKLISIMLVMALMLSTLVGCSSSDDSAEDNSLAYIQDKGVLVLGLDENFPPMGYRDTDTNEIVGFDIDVAYAVCEILGVELEIQPIDWSSNEQELNSYNIDCIWNGMTATDERDESMSLSISYMHNDIVLVVKEDSTVTSSDDLVGASIGVQGGSSSIEILNNLISEKELGASSFEFSDFTSALMDLDIGGVDAVVIDNVMASYTITEQGLPYVVLDEVLSSEEYAIGFRKDDVLLTEAVNAALLQLKEDGTLAEISIKYFGTDITTVE